VGAEQVGAEQVGAEQVGAEQVGAEQLSAELSFLESSLSERDLRLFEGLRLRLAEGRPGSLSELLNSPSARSWRVRLRELRASPRRDALLAPHRAPPPPPALRPLEELMELSGGVVMGRARAREREARVLRPSDFTLTEPHLLMHSDDESLERLWVTEREAHNALAPSDVLVLTKGVGVGVYLFPELRRQALPTLAHLNMIVLRARRGAPPEGAGAALLHPAFIAAWLTSREGLSALAARVPPPAPAEREGEGRTVNRSQLSLIEHDAPRAWALTLSDLRALRVPLPSPLRQALAVVLYCLTRELARQRAHLERARGAGLRAALSGGVWGGVWGGAGGARGAEAGGWDVARRDAALRAAHRAHLDALTQPFGAGPALSCERLDAAPLFPTLALTQVLRALTRYMIGLRFTKDQPWRMLNVVVRCAAGGEPRAGQAAEASRGAQEGAQEGDLGALEERCVNALHYALHELKEALTVEDAALGLPRVKPEQWFRFVGSRRHAAAPAAPPDLALALWVSAGEGDALGEARARLAAAAAAVSAPSPGAPPLSPRALVVTRLARWREEAGEARALLGDLPLAGALVALGVCGPPAPAEGLLLGDLDSFALGGARPLQEAELARWAREPVARLLAALRASRAEHAAHLATLEEQLAQLLGDG